MGVAMFVIVALAYAGGVAAAAVLGRRIVAALVRRRAADVDHRRSIMRMGVAGGLVALVPALLLGVVIGATLGGAYGVSAAGSAAVATSASIVGIGLGVFAVVAVILSGSVALGAWVGDRIGHGGE